jgi:hypothetical protein
MDSQTQAWVVVVSETIDGETTTQVVSDEYGTREEAELFAIDLAYQNPRWLVEVATEEDAAVMVTE